MEEGGSDPLLPPPPRARPRALTLTHAAAAALALTATLTLAGPGGGCSAVALFSAPSRHGPAYDTLLAAAGPLLPPTLHATLHTPPPASRGRTIIVGDVHGCADELSRLLEEVEFEKGRDVLILAGDAVAKGPASAAVLDMVLDLGATFVRGNHDDLALADWEAGKENTLNLTARHAALLRSLPWSVSLPDVGAVVVHAGALPGVPFERQSLVDLYTIKSVTGGGLFHTPLRASRTPGGPAWAPLWRGPPHVVFGHDSDRGLQLASAATGLDTGCVEGGELTALVIMPLKKREVGPWPGGDIKSVRCRKYW